MNYETGEKKWEAECHNKKYLSELGKDIGMNLGLKMKNHAYVIYDQSTMKKILQLDSDKYQKMISDIDIERTVSFYSDVDRYEVDNYAFREFARRFESHLLAKDLKTNLNMNNASNTKKLKL